MKIPHLGDSQAMPIPFRLFWLFRGFSLIAALLRWASVLPFRRKTSHAVYERGFLTAI
jgi:hypothetical protein